MRALLFKVIFVQASDFIIVLMLIVFNSTKIMRLNFLTHLQGITYSCYYKPYM